MTSLRSTSLFSLPAIVLRRVEIQWFSGSLVGSGPSRNCRTMLVLSVERIVKMSASTRRKIFCGAEASVARSVICDAVSIRSAPSRMARPKRPIVRPVWPLPTPSPCNSVVYAFFKTGIGIRHSPDCFAKLMSELLCERLAQSSKQIN